MTQQEIWEQLKTVVGGYCWAQGGGSGGYDWDDIVKLLDTYAMEFLKEIVVKIEEKYIDNEKEQHIRFFNEGITAAIAVINANNKLNNK